MRLIPIAVGLLVICSVGADDGEFVSTKAKTRAARKKVVEPLSLNTFDTTVGSSEDWLLEFYAPWCGHCKMFAPTYAEVAHVLTKEGIRVGKVNGEAERALAARFGVSSYPTIFHIHGNEVRPYEGPRGKEAVLRFARTGWKSTEPQPWLSSGMSPFRRAIGLLVGIFAKTAETAGPIADLLGVPPMVVQFFYVLFAILFVTGALIFFALYLGGHCQPPERPHRD